MKIAKSKLWGLLKIIDHLEEENKTLRDGCIRGYKQYDALENYVKYCILRYPNVKICGAEYADEKYEKGFDVSSWLDNIGLDKKNVYHA